MRNLVNLIVVCFLICSASILFVGQPTEASSMITATVNVKSGTLTVREKPSVTSKKLGSLKNKTKVTVYVKNKNEWSTIKYTYKKKKIKAYVSALYLKFPVDSYSQKELDYFIEIAFGAEWKETDYPIRKWKDPIRISVFGKPTKKDWESLKDVVSDINHLQTTVHLELVNKNPNVSIYYVPLNKFSKYVENPRPDNWGLFYYWWDRNYNIYTAKVLISTDRPTQVERSHLIREELTQALGLTRDSWKYDNSIFYQGWTRTTKFATIDHTLIQLLYDKRIKAGMSIGEVKNALED